MEVVPYKSQDKGKKEQVADMFDNISPKYDLLNRVLSVGIDVRWRKKAVKLLSVERPKTILDVATGTGDFALEASKLNPEKIVGVDISEGMLSIGREKVSKRGLDHMIDLQVGDSENLPFESNMFDAIIVAFGVRNFENLETGLTEMLRVLKVGGKLIVLEFSKPSGSPMKQLYNFYFRSILPKIGRLVSKDSSAYTYLPESVQVFPDGQKFLNILENIGYRETLCEPLTFGISSIYSARK